MINANLRYNQALAAFAVPGNRWQGILALTYWAVASGRCTEDVLDAVHGLGIHDRDGDIRRGMESATAKIAAYAAIRRPPKNFAAQRTQPPTTNQASSRRVRDLIEQGNEYDTPQSLRQLSPREICPDADWLARRVQCEMQLLAYFSDEEILHVFRTDSPMRGQPGVNLRPLGEWLDEQNEHHPDHLGEIVRPNPFTGEQGETNVGKPSYIAQGCLSAFRHMVFEFDHLALEDQCRFWAGFIKAKALPLVSLVYSGNKSIHGVIRVDAPDLPTWNHYRAKILSLYGTDPDSRYRLDPQALHPLTGTRLAGVIRKSTGKAQELLWLR